MRITINFATLFLAGAIAHGQSILTVAGGGPIGDGKPATEATLKSPGDVIVDGAGNLYIADTLNHRIRRVDAATGIMTTFAGGGTSGPGDGGPATDAEVGFPNSIAMDAGGNLYIGDSGPSPSVRKVDAKTGIITTVARNLCSVNSLRFGPEGNLYIAEQCQRVRKLDPRTGNITPVAGNGSGGFSGDGGPATEAAVTTPAAIAFDAAGNLFIGADRRIRKVDRTSGIITTIAGNGLIGPIVENVPALSAPLQARGLAFDQAGNLYLSRGRPSRIQRIDMQTGLITSVAGQFATSNLGDGGPASAASMGSPKGLTFDSSGNLLIADTEYHRIRKVDRNGIINTVAGGGSIGDGGPATSAQLSAPNKIALDDAGNLYIADGFHYRIRKLDLEAGTITTIAGNGISDGSASGDGGPATAGSFVDPQGVALDSKGNVYFSLRGGLVRRVDARTGIITTPVGKSPDPTGSLGDGGPAVSARLGVFVQDVTFDSQDNLYIADTANNRIRRVDARTSIISTVAGSGVSDCGTATSPVECPTEPLGEVGDGGPATSARLHGPSDVIFDRVGNLYIADLGNHRVRRVDATTGVITTIAGTGTTSGSDSDGISALQARVIPRGLAFDASENLYITTVDDKVRKVDAGTGTISTLIGGSRSVAPGDGGPASQASVIQPNGIVVNGAGDLYIADKLHNAIRVVYACVNVTPPSLLEPIDGATDLNTAPVLSWSSVFRAFRYDVYLDTVNPPSRLVASDLTVTAFTPSNLLPGVRYYWRVVAKGDPFCVPVSTNSSAVRSFTTEAGCEAPGRFTLTAPVDGATSIPSSVLLSWETAAGAGSYEVFVGPVSPPPFFASTTASSLQVPSLIPGTTYYWNIVARAVCDRTKTTVTPVRSFIAGGGCPAPASFVQIAPIAGATGVPTTATLEWSVSSNASSYDLDLGTANPPPAYLRDLVATKLIISGLDAGQTYFWRVTAKAACDPNQVISTPIASFTVRTECQSPGGISLISVPPAQVAVGQTYVVSWDDAPNLAPDGYYVVERSLSETFTTIVDTQQTAGTSASFVSASPGTYYHRVRSVNPCNLARPGSNSASKLVNVVPAIPNVIFTVQPQAMITTLGENLEDKKSRFVLENIGTDRVQVLVGRQEINSPPFFTIVDPLGGDASFFTLEPRKPKALEVRYSGPPNDQTASYQGVIFLASVGRGLAITPYAFVNLKVGGAAATAPQFLLNGSETEYVFFPGFAGDDSSRAPISVEVRNPGTAPMEVGAEIGPEVWLAPEAGWNSLAIPAGASRTLRLSTRRDRAPHDSALPRYTYLTLRTKSGETSRLLVQDNDIATTATGRNALADPSTRSVIIPEVLSAVSATGHRLFSTMRLTNLGSDAVQAELFFTPAGADGFDAARVHRATIVVPPNDVVSLTDPLTQLWGLSLPQHGQLEVRAAPEKIGQLAVGASVLARASGGGTQSYNLPLLGRGIGARSGLPHYVPGVSSSDTTRASLVLAETSGSDRASVRVTVHGSDGNARGSRLFEVPRYGYVEIDEVVPALGGGSTLDGGRIDLAVEGGGGSIVGVLKIIDRRGDGGSAIVSRPVPPPTSSKVSAFQSSGLMRFVIPSVVNGPLTPQGLPLQTTLGFHAPSRPATFAATYRAGDGVAAPISKSVLVAARQTVEYRNVIEQLFGLAPGTNASGSVMVETPDAGEVYARLTASSVQVGKAVITEALPVIPTSGETVTSRASPRPLYFDGLEQSIDPTRGTRWLLILNETSGAAATVTVRLYEAGNRSAAIAEKNFALAALQQLKLDTVFSAMDLDSENRRKDRTNVLVAVTPSAGDGVVSAVAISIDNRTGETKTHVLAPGSGPPGSVQKAVIGSPAPTRRRPIRRGE